MLAGATNARQTLESIGGSDVDATREAVRQAFVDSLGTSLKLSAALILVALVLSLVLMRRSSPVDAEPMPPVLGSVAPRPAPRRMA